MFRVLAIEIGNETIKIVEGFRPFNKDVVNIIKCISISTPEGAFDNCKIVDLKLIEATIERALRLNNIKAKRVIFIINNNSIIVRKMELPLLSKKSDTLSMIELEIERLYSDNLNHKIIYKKINDIGHNMASYVVYALSLDLYNHYMDLAEKLNLKLIAIEVSSRALEKIKDDGYLNNINVFINICSDTINFSVLNNGMNDYQGTIYLGSNANEIFIDKVAEAPFILNNYYYDYKNNKLNFIINEIYKQIRYYYYINSDDIFIDNIYFYGDCSEIIGNEEYLCKMFNAHVEVVKSISNVNCIEAECRLNIGEYLNCILSLFIDRKDVNFTTDKNNMHRFNVSMGIAIAAVSLFFLFSIFSKAQNSMLDNILLDEQLVVMRNFIDNEENHEINMEVERIKGDIILLEKYIEDSKVLSEMMDEEKFMNAGNIDLIINSKPANTNILFVSIDNNYINMQCKSHYIEEVILFIKDLREVNFISNVHVPSLFLKEGVNREYSYSIICDLGDTKDDG